MSSRDNLNSSQDLDLTLQNSTAGESSVLLTPVEETKSILGDDESEEQILTEVENFTEQVSSKDNSSVCEPSGKVQVSTPESVLPLPVQVSTKKDELPPAQVFTKSEIPPETQVFSEKFTKLLAQQAELERRSLQLKLAKKAGFQSETEKLNCDEMAPPIQPISLHPFTPHNPGMWLMLTKGKLKAMGVADEDLYKKIRMDMPIEIAERIPELIDPLPANDNFSYFENKVKEVFGKTREQDIRELLTKLSLDESGPKRLMDKMIQKAGTDVSPMVIADLFKQKLPKDVAKLLVSLHTTEIKTVADLNAIAETADKVHQFELHYSSPNKVSAISTGQRKMESDRSHTDCQKKISDLQSQVDHLRKVVDGLLAKQNGNQAGNNSRNGQKGNSGSNRNRSRSPSRSKGPVGPPKVDYSIPDNQGKCPYHIKYGEKAFHCILPCSMSDKLAEKRGSAKQQGNSNARQ